MSMRTQVEQARSLIKRGEYQQARFILVGIDHPKAREWLQKIDRIAPRTQAKRPPTQTTSNRASTRRVAPQNTGSGAISQGASGGITLMGLLALGGGAIGGGAVIGVLLYLSSRYLLYLIFVSSLIAGNVAGVILNNTVKLGKVRNGFLVIIFSVLMGLTIFGTYRYANYLWFLELVHDEAPSITQEEIDLFFNSETGESGFVGFVLYEAQEGLQISSSRRYSNLDDDSGTLISGTVVWIYWGVELLMFIGLPIISAFSQTKEPFCEEKNQWLPFKHVGNINHLDSDLLFQLIQQNDVPGVRSLFNPAIGDKSNNYLRVEVGDCGPEQPAGMIRVQSIQKDRRGRVNTNKVFESTLTREEMNILTRR